MSEKIPPPSEKSWTSTSPEETISIGIELGATLQEGDIIAISGDLGAGKTHLVKGLCQTLGIASELISSPTFTIVNEYHGSCPVYHFDFYRLDKIDELYELGYEEYFFGGGITIIEWPEKYPSVIPDTCLHIDVRHLGPTTRAITLKGQTSGS